MNYRHAYHAGNFADVVKHAVLCRVLVHLREKPAAFRVIDTHAGAGRYDLAGPEAGKTQEWRDGIDRLMRRGIRRSGPRAARALSRCGRGAQSGRQARHLSRLAGAGEGVAAMAGPADRLRARTERGRGARTRACRRRARQGDRDRRLDRAHRLRAAGRAARRRADRSAVRAAGRIRPPGAGAGGGASEMADRHLPAVVPDQGRTPRSRAFARRLARLGIAKMLRVELILPTAGPDTGLRGSGLIAVNPPWTLHDELKVLLPALADGHVARCNRRP